ncbi:MAG TPA: V-type ATP synthase subunit E family protein [Streptosporangiaceae bacterium]|nr:V-type ATP synthase subunit E family protein [Streptosporangiaceae bacterium]
MALPDLLAAIETEAAAETGRLRASRRVQADAILAEARQRARDLQAAAVAAAEREERQAGGLRLAAARATAAGRVRDAQEDAYQRIAQEVRERLRTVRGRDDYPAIMAALLDEARSLLPSASLIRVDPADEPLARRLLAGEPRVQVEPTLRCAGGLEAADGRDARVRNTVEERFAAAEPALRALAARLAAAAGPGPAAARRPEEVPA